MEYQETQVKGNDMSDKFLSTMNIKSGRDKVGDYLEHSLEINGMSNYVSKQYYSKIDAMILVAMPDDILEDIKSKVDSEIKRRLKND